MNMTMWLLKQTQLIFGHHSIAYFIYVLYIRVVGTTIFLLLDFVTTKQEICMSFWYCLQLPTNAYHPCTRISTSRYRVKTHNRLCLSNTQTAMSAHQRRAKHGHFNCSLRVSTRYRTDLLAAGSAESICLYFGFC